MLNFGYLNEKGIYLEKSFIVNHALKNKKLPTSILLLNNKEEIKNILKQHYSNESIKNVYFFKIRNNDYELIITDCSLILFSNAVISKEYLELLDENKINILNYYISIMEGKSEINDTYYNIYSVFEEDNIEIQNKLLKKIKRY